jgi:hypothetical protein
MRVIVRTGMAPGNIWSPETSNMLLRVTAVILHCSILMYWRFGRNVTRSTNDMISPRDWQIPHEFVFHAKTAYMFNWNLTIDNAKADLKQVFVCWTIKSRLSWRLAGCCDDGSKWKLMLHANHESKF